MTEFWTSLLMPLILLGFLSYTGNSQRFCHRCISIECTTSHEICQYAKEYMKVEIKKYYYTDGDFLPDCPDPSNIEEWNNLATQSPSKLPCYEIGKDQATCVLGRFRINSLVIDSNINLTTYGTVLGCANQKLLTDVRETTFGTKKKVITSLNTQMGCHSYYGQSEVLHSLQHFVQLEHCSQITDMCYTSDYCIHPRYTEVRPFRRDSNGDLMKPAGGVSFMSILIWVAVAIGILIVVVTFAGFKYA